MRRFPRLAAAAAMAAAFAAASMPAAAGDARHGDLEILSAWARATPPAARAGGGFLTIRNAGTAPDRLLGGRSPLGVVEVHSVEMDAGTGVMRMRPLPDGLEVPAGGTVELKPGGNHLMFMNLTAPFTQDAPVPVTLLFERAGEVPVELQVAPVGAAGPERAAGGHGGGHGSGGHGRH